MSGRADTSRQLAHDASRARRNFAVRADGITRMLIDNRTTLAEVVEHLDAWLPGTRGTDLLRRLARAVDDAERVKTEADEAHEAWLASILPSVDDAIAEVPA
ncbi:MAG: hypothetical protein L0L50_02400 [Propionibacterium sp.]|nr:hypothetical protein [Propionibacterium sp.]